MQIFKQIKMMILIIKVKIQETHSIDFENRIFKNLEYQQIRGKFLKSMDENDLRNLRFELFEPQILLKKSIGKEKQKHNNNEITLKNDTIIRPFLIKFDKSVSYYNGMQRYNCCRADWFKWKNKRRLKAQTFWLKKWLFSSNTIII